MVFSPMGVRYLTQAIATVHSIECKIEGESPHYGSQSSNAAELLQIRAVAERLNYLRSS